MGDKRKRSFDDNGDDHITKLLKIDNTFIENVSDADSEHSSVVSKSRDFYEFIDNRHRYKTSKDTDSLTSFEDLDNKSQDFEKNMTLCGPDGPISVPPIFYTTLCSILTLLSQLTKNPHHGGTSKDNKSDNLSTQTEKESQAIVNQILLHDTNGPVLEPQLFCSTMLFMVSELIKSPHHSGRDLNIESDLPTEYTDRKQLVEDHIIVKDQYPVANPIFNPPNWYRNGQLMESPHHSGRDENIGSDLPTEYTDRKQLFEDHIIVKDQYPVANPIFNPPIWYRNAKLMESPHHSGRDVNSESDSPTEYTVRKQLVEDHIIVKDQYPVANPIFNPPIWYRNGKIVKCPHRCCKSKLCSFWKPKSKSQANKGNIMGGDNTVPEQKCYSTLKDMIDDLMESPHHSD